MAIYRYLKYAYPLLLGFLFTTIFTYPLITKLTSFYKDIGDYPLIGWILWYNQKAILEGFIFDQVKYFDASIFYPYPFSLAYSEHLFIPSLLFTLIYFFTKNVIFSTNLIFFLSFVLSFTTSFYVINYFLKNRYSSIIGALIFTFNPLTFAHFADHFHLLNKYFLPPLFLYCYLFLIRPNFKNTIFFISFFLLNSLTSVYFAVFSSVLLIILVSGFCIYNLAKRNFAHILKLAKFGVLFVVILPTLLYFNLPYLEFSNLEGVNRPLSEVSFYSARLIDWVSPHPKSILYGQFYDKLERFREPKVDGYFNYSEHTLFPNIIPMILFCLGIFFVIKFKKIIPLSAILFFTTILLASILFTFGPQVNALKLPYYFFYKLLPIMKAVRVPTRFEFIFYIPFSLFAALGFYLLYKKFSKWGLLLFLAALVLLFLENLYVLPFDNKSQVFEKLNNEYLKKELAFLKGKNTIHVPLGLNHNQNEARYLSWATVTGERMFNGYSGYAPLDRNNFIERINHFDKTSIKSLLAIGIEYIIFHKDLVADYKSIDLLKAGNIFEDSDILIVDLKRITNNVKLCDNILDLDIKESVYLVSTRIEYRFGIVNKNDCYFVSKFRNRYIPFKSKLKNDTIFLRMPILIGPKEEIVFTL